MDDIFFETGNADVFPVSYLLPDLDEVVDESKFVMYVNSKKVGSVGNFICITGKPKARKSVFAYAILSSAITRMEMLGIGIRLPDDRQDIVLVDTEQDRNDILLGMQRLKRQTKLPSLKHIKNLFVYSVSILEPALIIAFMTNLFKKNNHIGIVVIDGLLDLINDMNDIKESRKLMQHLKIWAIENQCLIVTILHQSKSANFSIGHLGSFADRKAQAVLQVEKSKDEEQSILSAQYMRSDRNFDEVVIEYDVFAQCYVKI